MVQRFGDQHFAADFFTTLRFEGELRDCEVEGEIPRDMHGTFYRLGGDWLYRPQFPHDPPFSADGYVSMFRFANGRVDYKGKFVRTPRFLANQKAGRQLFGMYRNRLSDDPLAKGVNGTVANTTPVVHAGKLFATKEDARPFEIDPHTLETKGEWDFHGKYKSLTFTAHPKIDPISGEMICFGYEATGELSDDVFMYAIDKAGHVTREVRLKMPYVSMLHDIAITRDHIVLPVYGLATDKEYMAGNNPHWAWNSKLPGYVAVLPRNGEAKDVRWFKGPSKAMIHTLNANVEGNKLILDAPVSDGNPFPFFPDRHGGPWNPMAGMTTIRRWTFDLNGKSEGWEEENLFPQAPGALSRIDDRFTSLPYRYSYMGYHDPTKPFDVPRAPNAPPTFPVTNCIGRFDMRARKMDSFFIGSVGSAQEACFVPRSQKAAEGDGYLVSVYGNIPERRSELVIVDAMTMEQRARVILPFRISEQVHGVWASRDEIPF